MCLKAAVTGAPGPSATSVLGHLEMVLLFADGPHGGDRVRFTRVLLHSLLPAEAKCQDAGREGGSRWAQDRPTNSPKASWKKRA